MFSWIFALVHLVLYLGLFFISILYLIEGQWWKGIIFLAFLVAYYFLVLHQAVLKEIRRKRKPKKNSRTKKPKS
ncbi:MAG: hypothetical protein ACPLZD_02275 [Candidatus Saccharicenans sp.]|nr:MAG: hypothetical protein C0168_06670 [Candidatus Aminicenantes bacterium]HEK84763.1 hypothetical protein [Candidatus Aminicenantes bacterium]